MPTLHEMAQEYGRFIHNLLYGYQRENKAFQDAGLPLLETPRMMAQLSREHVRALYLAVRCLNMAENNKHIPDDARDWLRLHAEAAYREHKRQWTD